MALGSDGCCSLSICDAFGALETEGEIITCLLYTSYDGTEIAYDAIGNPLSYLGKTLIWQNGRQLASLNDTDLTVNYAYDDSGIRIQKTVNGTETKFYLNGTVILTQMTGNERMDFLYDEAGDLLGFKYDGNSYYYIRNLQSDITGILNSAGEQIVSYAYAVSYTHLANYRAHITREVWRSLRNHSG